jgi:hypothetical protein
VSSDSPGARSVGAPWWALAWLSATALWMTAALLSVLHHGDDHSAAYVTGAFAGRATMTLAIALALRWLVRWFVKRPVLRGPWVLAIAAGISLVVLLPRAVEAVEEGAASAPPSAAALLAGLPPGFSSERMPRSIERQMLAESNPPPGALERVEDLELRRVLRGGEPVGFVGAIVADRDLNEEAVRRGFASKLEGPPEDVEIGGKDAVMGSAQGIVMILDVAGAAEVFIGAFDEGTARRLAQGLLLD